MLRCCRCAARLALPLLVIAHASWAPATVITPEMLTAKFAAMNGNGWTGGDATWSTRLPDRRTVWIFGDTFIGGVRPDGRRERSSPLVRNSIVVQGRDGTMTTLLGSGGGAPHPLVAGRTPDDWYWPGPPIVGRRTLEVPMAHIVRTGQGDWDIAARGTSLAEFALPDLRLQRLLPIATPDGVNMASAAVSSRRFTYVYGTRDDGGIQKRAYVARAPVGELRRDWAYWDGHGWSADPAAAAPIADWVSDQFSVLRIAGGWALVTQVPMGREIVAAWSRHPTGPWEQRRLVARVPGIAGAFTYNATIHPEFSIGKRVMLGFNVNGLDMDRVFGDAALYRPRFMAIRLRCHHRRGAGQRPAMRPAIAAIREGLPVRASERSAAL
jgi:Domain of unknown function (DUF4185)